MPTIERRFHAGIAQVLKAHDAPVEIYARYGVEAPRLRKVAAGNASPERRAATTRRRTMNHGRSVNARRARCCGRPRSRSRRSRRAAAQKPFVDVGKQPPITILIASTPWYPAFEKVVGLYEQQTGNKIKLDVDAVRRHAREGAQRGAQRARARTTS